MITNQENVTAEGLLQRRLRYPAMVELMILGGLVIILMIALSRIRSLVAERSLRAVSVQGEISSIWGKSQTIGGPVLIVPFRVRSTDGQGRDQVVMNRAYFLPERLKIAGRIFPERRHRGIFETVVYRADLALEGEFARPDFSGWNVLPEDILWSESLVTIGIPDLRGIRGTPRLKWNDESLAFSGGSSAPALWVNGLNAAIPPASLPGAERHGFSLKLELNGSETIGFYPLGGETQVSLASPWPDPTFNGAFLPESRSVTAAGFNARWRVSSLARSFPQRWRECGGESSSAAVAPSAFGVGLFSPVSHYQQTERSIKYGVLFILLTFLTFFLYELLSPVTLHPAQYFLVGGALCLFYLLLLSISEHASFAIAYGIASLATVTLICSYAAALLQNRLRVLGLLGALALLYGYLYVLLQLEDWALLMGSIGLFLILSLVMYTTRKVDWGSAHLGRVRSEGG